MRVDSGLVDIPVHTNRNESHLAHTVAHLDSSVARGYQRLRVIGVLLLFVELSYWARTGSATNKCGVDQIHKSHIMYSSSLDGDVLI